MSRLRISDFGFRICRFPKPVADYVLRLTFYTSRITFHLSLITLLMCGSAFGADENVCTLSADITRWHPDNTVTASGNVQAAYRDYKVTADSVEADLEENIAVFQGNVKLTTAQHEVQGERLRINLKTRDWSLEQASSTIDPKTFQGRLAGPAFIQGVSLSGKEEDMMLKGGTLTTCDREHPHYYFSARELEIHPDSKIIARDVSVVGLDKRLFTLHSLVIPIKGFKYNIVPQVGSSAEEGMFLKTAYAYTATAQSQGFLKLDLMQKRGLGTGVEHTYRKGLASGLVSLYYLADREIGANNITGRFQHQQKLGSINLNLTSDYRTNSYLYFPASTTQNYQVGLNRMTSKANTALTFNSNANRGFGNFETLTSTLRHTQQLNNRLGAMLSMDMRTYKSPSLTAPDRELESIAELRQRDDKYDLSLIMSRRTDLDGDEYTGDDFYSALDRLPELRFETDSYRLGKGLLFGLPSRLSVSAGKYHEMPGDVTSDRLLLQWDMLGRNIDLGSRSELNLTAGLRQAYYKSNMAQYVMRAGGVLTTRYNDYLRTRLTYNYQRPDGFSPFRFDYTGKYNYLRAVTDYQDERELRWSLSTGYDLNRRTNPWQDLALRLTAHPNSNYAFSISTGYDINRSKWRNLINQLQVSVPGKIDMSLGTRYDLADHRLGLARGRLDLHLGSKWRVEGITSWNGTTKKFDYKAFRLTRDLHCWEASLVYNDETGFRTDKGFRLELRIKAFPGVDRFGIGQFGQSVDTSMGEYYY